MKFGCCTSAANAGLLANAGYDYIELGVSSDLKPLETEASPVDALKSILKTADLPVEAFNLFVPGSLKITGPERRIDLLKDYVAVAAERAAELGGKVIVFGSGGARQVPSGYDFEIAEREIVTFLRDIADILAANGIELAIEPLQRSECNIINSVAEGAAIVKRVGRTDVINVLSDQYHVLSDKQSYDETANAGSMLRHVHVALGADRHPPTLTDLSELAAYFRALKSAGYDRRVSIEANWKDLYKDAAEALSVLKLAWAEAGPK
jgi:sugar phosphate isomerase/epimerase